jgi:hypothetical protein
LKKRLHAISDRSAEKWITKLDSGVYAEREQAMQELSKLEFAVLAPIKVRLKETTSSEFKARAAKLLLDLDNPLLEWRCQWSALGILEQIGNSEARDLLQALCLGAAEAKLTKLAQATLLRMKK